MKTEKLQWLWKEIAVWIQLVREQHHNKSNFDGIKSPFLFREIVLQSILNFGFLGFRGLITFGARDIFWGEHWSDSQRVLDSQNLKHCLKWTKSLVNSLRERLWEHRNSLTAVLKVSNLKWDFRKVQHFRQKRPQTYIKISPQWDFKELIYLNFDLKYV